MNFEKSVYQEKYKLNDKEIAYFDKFFSDSENIELLDKIRVSYKKSRFIYKLVVLFAPIIICGLFFMVYTIQGTTNSFFVQYIIMLYLFLLSGLIVGYFKLFKKTTFTKKYSNLMLDKIFKSISKDGGFLGNNENSSIFFVQINDRVFFSKDLFNKRVGGLSGFVGTFNNLSKKGLFKLTEFVKEKEIEAKYNLSDQSDKDNIKQVVLNGKEVKRIKDTYYKGPKDESPEYHSYFFKCQFNGSKVNIDNGIKVFRRGNVVIENNYHFSVFLLGLYFIFILYFFNIFIEDYLGFNIYIYIALILGFLFVLAGMMIYGIIKNNRLKKKISDEFEAVSLDENEANKKLLKGNFYDIVNEFMGSAFYKNRNYEIYFKDKEMFIKYDIKGVNWEVSNLNEIYDPFILFYLDNKNLIEFVKKISRFYY